MRLIKANGYANTTIEQIAEAAEVAPSTYFRYFPTKESVMIANDLDQVTVDALAQQPADMEPVKPFGARSRPRWPPSPRRSGSSNATVSDGPDGARTESRSVGGVPPHRAEAGRGGRPAHRARRDDLEIRVFVGALAGGMMAALDGPTGLAERMYQTLDFLEAGMPLQ